MTVLLRTPAAGLQAKVRASQVWFVRELLWAFHITIPWSRNRKSLSPHFTDEETENEERK